MWPIRPPQWVGREPELALLRAAIEALARGEGTAVWIEGEPGIGKSALVAEALARTGQPGWDIGWGGADQLTARLPLRVMQECLQVRPSSPDPRRARAANLLQSRLTDGDSSADGVEVLLTLVDELCAVAPMVLVVDDMQWADEASLAVWHQLATSISQLQLLLIGTCRPTPRRPESQRARAAVTRRGGPVIALGPLPEADVTALVTAMVGAAPGAGLQRLTAQASGNPLYVYELVDALLREHAVQISPVADVTPQSEQLPVSLSAVLDDRLTSVSAETAQLLRTAALLGGKFAVTDLSVVLRRPALDLAANLQEAVSAGIVEDAGAELAFRHPLIQQALYESMPEALRTALHAEVARELAEIGADALRVAQQLSAANKPSTDWARSWLIQAAPALATRAPQLAVELLRGELEVTPDDDETWQFLVVGLIRALLAVGGYQEAVARADGALAVLTNASARGETAWMLVNAQVNEGRGFADVAAVIRQTLATADLPLMWQSRLLALLALLERATTGWDVADAIADQALAVAEEAGDPATIVHVLAITWVLQSVARDHAAALASIDRALLLVGDDPRYNELHANFLEPRTFVLQNLDEWQEAELALGQSREFALRTGRPDRATWASAAVLRYWFGQWDDALTELGSDTSDLPGLVYSFLRERWSALLIRGVAALIAGRREDRATADRHLREGLALPIENLVDRENQDFLVAAHALSLEQRGETRQAMLRLVELLPRGANEMTLVYQWMPDLIRLARAVGDEETARTAASACQAEAAAETRPARAAAASLRCYGLLESDPDRLYEAVAHYRAVGPALELPAALEDLAVVLAERGQEDDARTALSEAVSLYEGMQARWDVRRAEGRLRPYGIRRGVRGRRPARPTSGWEALTPTELKIAALVARGDATSDIARGMYLSRRTVQTYISHILTKLDAKSRVDIVREALRQGVTP